MKNLLFFVLIGLTATFFSSCNIVDAPFVENTSGGGTIDTTDRVVLVEEFTGFKCKNCPEASHALHALAEGQFKDKIIVVAVHAGTLAKPNTPPAHYSSMDLRTEEGTQLSTDFLVDFVPLALINRVPGPTGPWFEKSGWEGAILTETTKEAEAKLSVSNAYNTSSREITITVTGKFLKEATDNENLALYLIENELVGEQDSASVYLPNYHHKNILRDMILGTYGEKITTAIAGAGFNFTKTYTHTLPATLAPENCSIVAVLQNGDTKLVRQAASAHILP